MSTSVVALEAAQKESVWRERIARQMASGKTIAVFCAEEAIGQSTFSYWRRRLGMSQAGGAQKASAGAAPFVEVGALKTASSLELRLELGGGVVLHIARH